MKNYLTYAGIVAVAVLLSALLIRPTQNVVNRVTENLGATPGSDFSGPCLSVNGEERCMARFAATIATSTPCAIKSPSATSTLVTAAFRVSSTSASAVYFEWGKSATQYATTTSLGTNTLASGAQATLVASTTISGTDPATVFAPNQYLVVKTAGAGETQLGGICQGTFETI